jgi:hypothetical protein
MAEAGSSEVEPFRVLDTRKRRSAGVVYLIGAAIAGSVAVAVSLPMIWLTAVSPLIALALYQVVCAWNMGVKDTDAIAAASDTVSFPVGHASATLGYRGWLARPVWQVLVFADGAAPEMQGLVTIDAVDGNITGTYEESVATP